MENPPKVLEMPVFSPNIEFLNRLKETTPARIGIGRAGERYPTKAQLKFKLDLSVAKDAVYRAVNSEVVQNLGVLSYGSMAQDKKSYLMNLKLGRRLDDNSANVLLGQNEKGMDVQIILSDGLSSEAFENNVPLMLPILEAELKRRGTSLGKSFFVKHARVALMDHVGELLKPKVSLILLGERPGLGISDSLSGYFVFRPCFERVESDRNVLSNIHRLGIPPTEAALILVDALLKVLMSEKSGMSVRFDCLE